MSKEALCMRLSEQTIYQLDWLCETSNMKRSEVITNLISNTFDKMTGNEEIKALFGQLKDIENQLENLANNFQ